MSNMLKSARAELSLQLSSIGEGQVYLHIPARPNALCFVISPGAPYVEDGETFTDFRVRFEVLILSGVATNETETDNLDDYIVKVIDNVETWNIEAVEQPSQYEINGILYLGTKINLLQEKTL